MGCGCRDDTKGKLTRNSDGASGVNAAGKANRQTAYAMCHLCPWATRAKRGAPTHCMQLSMPIVLTVGRCPVGRHPDDDGNVRWLRVRWMGAPWPLRRRLPQVDLPGCGCVWALKSLVRKANRLQTWDEFRMRVRVASAVFALAMLVFAASIVWVAIR